METAPAVELEWDTPLDASIVGVELPPAIDGASLMEIVSGQVDARGEGRACSACHFGDTVTLYQPEIPQFSTAPIGPYDIVHGRTWAGNWGWASIFTTMGAGSFVEKPEELRDAMALWVEAESQRVEPLGWDVPIVAGNLGKDPESFIAGDTVGDIVNSVVPGRPDDLVCSACHFEGGPVAYRPAIAANAVSSFGPDDLIDGRTWAEPFGWADRFAAAGPNAAFHKPDYLRQMFFKWKDDGAY
ncbi:MAG: hypothetical protein KC656_15515 [Myxococcales bacterium]|nr:hypothetical protein [Myxococcales bacterium]